MISSRPGRASSVFAPQILVPTVILCLCRAVCTTKYADFNSLLGVEKCVMVYYNIQLSIMDFL